MPGIRSSPGATKASALPGPPRETWARRRPALYRNIYIYIGIYIYIYIYKAAGFTKQPLSSKLLRSCRYCRHIDGDCDCLPMFSVPRQKSAASGLLSSGWAFKSTDMTAEALRIIRNSTQISKHLTWNPM